MNELINKTSMISNLISPRRDINKPIFNWHAFKHSYSLDLVKHLMNLFKLNNGSWVLDPFCGGGTTLLACKQAGINCHGYDILPFSVLLSNVKTRNYSIESLEDEKKKVIKKKSKIFKSKLHLNIPIIDKAFDENVKRELFKIKQIIEEIENKKIKDFFNLGFLSILENVSQTKKSGGFLRIVEKNTDFTEIFDLFIEKVSSMINDVKNSNRTNPNVEAFLGDARNLSNSRIYDAVITSPPYPNRHDYTRIYSLEMIFGFVSTNDELKKIRYETLRSHVEAKKKYEVIGYITPKILLKLIKRIISNGVNNTQIISMILGYFEDMFLVLKEISKSLCVNGNAAIVISNVRFSGVSIPVDEILSEIGEQVGLKTKSIWIARYRGNSSQQMKIYNRVPSRESIILFEKE